MSLERVLRNLPMPSLEYQPSLFGLAILRKQPKTLYIHCEKIIGLCVQ